MRFHPDDLRQYALRDWGAPERLARRERAALPIERKVALAVSLYEAARAAASGARGEESRRRDLESHIELRQKLSRAAHVGAG